MFTNPEDLLPAHQHLVEEDFEQLGEGSAINRQYWIANMESAISATERVQQGYGMRVSMLRFNKPRRQHTHVVSPHNGS